MFSHLFEHKKTFIYLKLSILVLYLNKRGQSTKILGVSYAHKLLFCRFRRSRVPMSEFEQYWTDPRKRKVPSIRQLTFNLMK